jgi:hypothetical protein
MDKFSYSIEGSLGTLNVGDNGWRKELNIVSWNGREPKYDIRDWAPEKERMGRGVTFSKDEIVKLKELLNTIEV